MKYAMIFDSQKCIGCQACTIACKSENNIPDGLYRLKVKITGPYGKFPKLNFNFERFSCQMCENTPCVTVCPTHASFMDSNGVVDIKEDLCVGCLYCIGACPYGARFLNPETKIPDKCNFCKDTHLKLHGEPACVSVCPGNALIFGDLDNENDVIYDVLSKKNFIRKKEYLNTKPKLFIIPTKKGEIKP
ncbi:polysulfide/thiosulfate reductase, subunit B [Campylobacter subantarcticus]|uniref:Putative thiosulfate/polysulfide reductase, 4Fe-4S iron-sulfur binding domain-containing subunit n=1 Tax=Campylobacter subantarcticus LMG 24374 TaxID=1388751 RepID=A0A0A8HE15_9BACT|nr:polysulfide/thiosulfate reductase, subunit B [Campylobacter subantarcticus]AJC91154.1 putative thiosulfate/polysulfide reductase, 4Fe-4S iron-sulfur binding domain-containing subunit [Campylobacter subantarcticus LMG 24374]EAJ1261650.1 polysulfide/thiosulfate reductase, subunit B [Campylobacter lari]